MSDDTATDIAPAAADEPTEKVKPPKPAEIEDEIVAARARLAQSVDALAEEANPAMLAKKGAERVRGFFVREDGSVRGGRVAKTAGAIAGLIVVRGIIRRGS